MDRFIVHHRDRIVGTLSCFDRVLFKGHLPISHPNGLEQFLSLLGAKLMDFKEIALDLADRLKQHAVSLAQQAGRAYRYLDRPLRKEDLAREIAARDGITRGLVCVLGAVEPAQAFRLAYGQGRPRLASAWRKCLVHYFYLFDPELGFLHVRRPTWFPFTMQVCVNGHDWLARRMNRLRLVFQRLDNAFLTIARPERADRLAREFPRLDWPDVLGRFARRFNPLLEDILQPMQYYWVTDQAEYATDVMFRSRADLQSLYPPLLRYATLAY